MQFHVHTLTTTFSLHNDTVPRITQNKEHDYFLPKDKGNRDGTQDKKGLGSTRVRYRKILNTSGCKERIPTDDVTEVRRPESQTGSPPVNWVPSG